MRKHCDCVAMATVKTNQYDLLLNKTPRRPHTHFKLHYIDMAEAKEHYI